MLKRFLILLLVLALAAPAHAIKYKGDLEPNESIAFPEQSATPASPTSGKYKLYVKDDGAVYTLDSSGNENPVDAAGLKNKIINGNFDIWQRGASFSFTGPGTGGLTADRWRTWEIGGTGGSVDVDRSAFTLGQTAVPGHPEFYLTWNYTRGDADARLFHRIENVFNFSQSDKWTYSFWAKAAVATTMTSTARFNMGSGGIGGGGWPQTGTFSLTTSWQKFNVALTPLDLTGDTLGTSSYTEVEFKLTASAVVDIARVQFEKGSVATAFEKRPIGLELALAQRYYQKTFPLATAPAQNAGTADALCYNALLAGVNKFNLNWYLKTPMRTDPTVTYYNPSAVNNKFRNTPDAGDSGTPVTDVLSPNYIFIRNPQIAADGAGEQICIHATVDAEL